MLHSLSQAIRDIGLYVNANKIELMYLKQEAIAALSSHPLESDDHFTYLSNNISSTETYALKSYRQIIDYVEI